MKKERFVKYFPLPVVVACAVAATLCSQTVAAGIRDGLQLCAQTLIPSLFIFLCLCQIAVPYTTVCRLPFSGAYSALFHAPRQSAALFLLALLGGYPAGPLMCATLLQEGKITAAQARRLPLFCCGAGPAFCIIAVGENLCGSKKTGVILLASTVLAQILIGITTGFFERKNSDCKVEPIYSEPPVFFTVFHNAVSDSITAMLGICAYVCLFSVLLRTFTQSGIPLPLKNGVAALLEVGNGTRYFAGNAPVLAFVLGFGGVSIYFQIKKSLDITGTKWYWYFLSRLASGALSFLWCNILLRLFPAAVPTLAGGMQVKAVSDSAKLSAALIISFAVFILDHKDEAFFSRR